MSSVFVIGYVIHKIKENSITKAMIAVIENISIEYHVSATTRTNNDKEVKKRYAKRK